MDSFGSLALATELPERDILKQKPVPKNAAIISPGMIRNIVVSCSFQMAI